MPFDRVAWHLLGWQCACASLVLSKSLRCLLIVPLCMLVPQVRRAVRLMLERRAGEAPLSGREARHLVAMLDVNGNGSLSRAEFDAGLKDCR